MNEFLILLILKIKPLNIYEIKKFIDENFAPFLQVSVGMIIPALNRLEKAKAVKKETTMTGGGLKRSIYSLDENADNLINDYLQEKITSAPQLLRREIDVLMFIYGSEYVRYCDNTSLRANAKQSKSNVILNECEGSQNRDASAMPQHDDSRHSELVSESQKDVILKQVQDDISSKIHDDEVAQVQHKVEIETTSLRANTEQSKASTDNNLDYHVTQNIIAPCNDVENNDVGEICPTCYLSLLSSEQKELMRKKIEAALNSNIKLLQEAIKYNQINPEFLNMELIYAEAKLRMLKTEN